jgi:protein involved in gliding motility SprA
LGAGAEIDSLTEIGNTITNQRQFDISGRFNLVSLYNKNKFLAKVNQKFTPTTRVHLPAQGIEELRRHR